MFHLDFMNSLNESRLQAFDVIVMQSNEYTNKIIEIFKQKILDGENPNDCQFEVYEEAGIKDFNSDILSSDQRRIQEEVEKMYNKYILGIF